MSTPLQQALSNAGKAILSNDYHCRGCKYGTLIVSKQEKSYEKGGETCFAYTVELTIVCDVQSKKLVLFQDVFDSNGKENWTKMDDITTIVFCEAREAKAPPAQVEGEDA